MYGLVICAIMEKNVFYNGLQKKNKKLISFELLDKRGKGIWD